MQKLTRVFGLLVAVAATAYLTSCDVEPTPDPDGPSIALTDTDGAAVPSTIEGQPGDTYEIDVRVDAPGGFNVLRWGYLVGVSDSVGGGEEIRTNAGDTVYETTVTYTFNDTLVGDAVQIVFQAVDDNAKESYEYVNVTTNDPPNPINSYSTTLLYAPTGDLTSKTFFSTNTGETYSRNDVENTADPVSINIDFGYYYGLDNDASLAAPNSYPSNIYDLSSWGSRNSTNFRSTTADFDAVGDNDGDVIVAAYENGTDIGEVVTELSIGDVLAFTTDADKEGGSKFGLIKVVDISGTDGSNDYISLDVKIEQ